PDRLPVQELHGNLAWGYEGCALYVKPGYDGTVYVECPWNRNPDPLYVPAAQQPLLRP
ncbi:MAG: hypothetical protein HFG10_09565, partial [Oscillibacter sp.]|nr:hypothetical protein [Oscillibacter sp.]